MIEKLLKKAAIFLACFSTILLMKGCAVPFPVYSPAGKNVQAIRAVPATVEVGKITGTQTSVSCRLQPIGPQNGQTFASYIAKAINEEIIISGGVQHDTSLTVNGKLKNIDVNCGFMSGFWVEVDPIFWTNALGVIFPTINLPLAV